MKKSLSLVYPISYAHGFVIFVWVYYYFRWKCVTYQFNGSSIVANVFHKPMIALAKQLARGYGISFVSWLSCSGSNMRLWSWMKQFQILALPVVSIEAVYEVKDMSKTADGATQISKYFYEKGEWQMISHIRFGIYWYIANLKVHLEHKVSIWDSLRLCHTVYVQTVNRRR